MLKMENLATYFFYFMLLYKATYYYTSKNLKFISLKPIY